MNRLILQIITNVHLRASHKWRALVMQVFGHEALVDVTEDLRDSGHCIIFDYDVYRLAPIKMKQLAYRKLLNPFKWLEFAIALPLEMLGWVCYELLNRAHDREFKHKSKIEKDLLGFFINFDQFIAIPILNLVTNICLGLVRRVLAPVRYIIRPSIELAYQKPNLAFILFMLALVIAPALLMTGPLGWVMGSVLAGFLAAKVAFVMAATLGIWATLLKCVTGAQEINGAVKRAREVEEKADAIERESDENIEKIAKEANETIGQVNAQIKQIEVEKKLVEKELDQAFRKETEATFAMAEVSAVVKASKEKLEELGKKHKEQMKIFSQAEKKIARAREQKIYDGHDKQLVEVFRSGSTDKITHILHAVMPERTEVRSVKKQDSCYTLALFLGVESFFYKRKKPAGYCYSSEKEEYNVYMTMKKRS